MEAVSMTTETNRTPRGPAQRAEDAAVTRLSRSPSGTRSAHPSEFYCLSRPCWAGPFLPSSVAPWCRRHHGSRLTNLGPDTLTSTLPA